MNENEVVIEALSNIVAEKRQRYQMLGANNIYGLTEAERMRASMAYAQAQSELMNAESDLRVAIAKASP